MADRNEDAQVGDDPYEFCCKQAVISVRPLIDKYKSLNRGELVPPIKNTTTQTPGWSANPSTHRGLIRAATVLLNCPVIIKKFPRIPNVEPMIAAMMRRYSDRIEIDVSEEENFCYQRFYVAKELCHAFLIERVDNTQTKSCAEVVTLISDLLNGVTPRDANTPLMAEEAAYYGAIEILLPSEFQEEILRDVEAGMAFRSIAVKYRVPEKLIQFRYARTDIVELYNDIYSSHDYKTYKFAPVRKP